MYIQKLIRNVDIETAIQRGLRQALNEGYRVYFAQAEVQRNLFHDHEDVFVTLEVEHAS